MGAEEGVSLAISVIHWSDLKQRGFPRADFWDGCDALPHDEPRFASFLLLRKSLSRPTSASNLRRKVLYR